MRRMTKMFLFCGCVAVCLTQEVQAGVMINEILADPPAGISGDANRDGIRDAYDDEFVELVNIDTESFSISGWTLWDLVGMRHTFSTSAIVPPEGFFVVFGGGDPFGFEHFETSSTGTLGLNNAGDTLFLYDREGYLVDSLVYGSEGGQDVSLTRFPDATGPFVKHSLVNDRLFSPGTTVDGESQLPHASAIPEPTTLSLMGFGLLGLGFLKSCLLGLTGRKRRQFLGAALVLFCFSSVGFAEGMWDEVGTRAADNTMDAEMQEVKKKAETKEVWEEVTNGIPESNFRTIAVDPADGKFAYVGTSKSLHRTTDGGKRWERVLSLRGTYKAVNQIWVISPKELWSATDNGLFTSQDKGKTWEKRFSGLGEKGRKVLSFATQKSGKEDFVFIGTGEGFFVSNDGGRHWERGGGELSDEEVSFLAIEPQRGALYAAAPKGVYRSRDFGKIWERIFVTSVEETESFDDNNTLNSTNANEDLVSEEAVTAIVIKRDVPFKKGGVDREDGPREIFLGTKKGIYQSGDEGMHWSRLSEIGLGNSEVNHLFLHQERLYAATQEGLFFYLEEQKLWKEISAGLTEGRMVYLGGSMREPTLWAISGEGVFKMKGKDGAEETKGEAERWKKEVMEILRHFDHEPSVEEIQEAAIRYAEVHPEKILAWRRAATRKAWLPKISTGVDIDIDRNVDLDRGGTGDTDFFILGPDERKFNWDIDVTWDLGEIIWNDDQTSIDVRSKLMVQLRDDILDEVTRLYFERRRLQVALLTTPPKTLEDQVAQELRLQELTADIDALTGGYLSRVLRGELKSEHLFRRL